MERCIFCANPADSKEDLFPRWILHQVKTRVPLYRQMGDAPPEITEDQEVRIPCVCKKCNNEWMSRMETTVKRFLGPMIEDLSFPLDRQNQQNLTEWVTKCAMINDAVDVGDPHARFFTEAERRAFKEKRKIPERTQIWVARFNGRSLDSNGVDFTLIDPKSGGLLVRGHVYNVMVGHVVLQVLSWHPEPLHQNKLVQIRSMPGPWRELTIQIWPLKEKSVNWPPRLSLSARPDRTNYAYFRVRFKSETGHRLLIPKPKARQRST